LDQRYRSALFDLKHEQVSSQSFADEAQFFRDRWTECKTSVTLLSEEVSRLLKQCQKHEEDAPKEPSEERKEEVAMEVSGRSRVSEGAGEIRKSNASMGKPPHPSKARKLRRSSVEVERHSSFT
jgi:hypothetical protein